MNLDFQTVQQRDELLDPNPLKFWVPDALDGADHHSSQPWGELHTREIDEVVRTCTKEGKTKLRCIADGPGAQSIRDGVCVPRGEYDVDHPFVVISVNRIVTHRVQVNVVSAEA